MAKFSAILIAVVVAAAHATGPSGTYSGSKSIIGQSIAMTATTTDGKTMELAITGSLVTADCKGEAYAYDAATGAISVPGASKSGDCINSALSKAHAKLGSIQYDASADTITVTTKVSFLKVAVVLKKQSALVAMDAAGAILKHNIDVSNCEELKVPQDDFEVFWDDLGCSMAYFEAGPCPEIFTVTDTTETPFKDYPVVSLTKKGIGAPAKMALTAGRVTNYTNSTAGPSGKYSGSKSIIGKSIAMTATTTDGKTMELAISGNLVTADCKGEAYAYDASTGAISVPGASKSGDCINSALSKAHAKLDSIQYDASADTITVTSKISILKVAVVLTKQST